MGRRGVWKIVVLNGAAVLYSPLATAAPDSGPGDGSSDGPAGTGGSVTDAQGAPDHDASISTGGAANDAAGTGGASQKNDASRPLTGTSAVSCGEPAGSLSREDLPSCTDVCPTGFCVPVSQVQAQAAGLPNCTNSTDKCMPVFLIETLGHVRFKSCRSVGNAEGRCLPTCLPIVGGQVLPLPQSDCLST